MKKSTIVFGLVVSHLAVAFLTYVLTTLDTQSYYAASVSTLLQETQASIDAADATFAERLRRFAAQQPVTYEGRSNLLENARKFQAEGDAIRARHKNAR